MEQTAEGARLKTAIILLSDKMPASFKEVQEQLSKDPETEVHIARGVRECMKLLAETGRGIVLFSISKKEDLVEVLTLLVNQQAMMKNNLLRVLGCNQLDPNFVNPVLMKKGCSDILAPNATAKAVIFKVNRWMKLIESTWEKSTGALTRSEAHFDSSPKAVEEVRKAPEAISCEPVSIAMDYWLKGRKTPRFLMGKWIIELIGPAPTEGRWEAAENDRWKWTVSKKDGPFSHPGGTWYFTGKQPEFDSQNLIWQFIAEKPQLVWEGEGGPAFRLRSDERGRLLVANDSAASAALFPKIEKSLQFQFKISTDPKSQSGDYLVDNLELSRRPTDDLHVQDETPADWNLDFDGFGTSVKILRKAGEIEPATFKDLFDDRIILESPWAGQPGEAVAIAITTENTTPRLNFKLNGTVDVSEKDRENAFSLTLVLEDHKNPLLEQFSKLVLSRQNSIVAFFKAAKGA